MKKINFKKSIEIINKNRIIVSTLLLITGIGIYYVFSRYIHTISFPESLAIFLVPLALICGSGIWGGGGIFPSSFFCYSDIMIITIFVAEGFILGWFIQWLINKIKQKNKNR